MYAVTQRFKNALDSPLRNTTSMRITFGVTEPDAPGASNPTDNGHLSYSNVAAIDMGALAPLTYQTLEQNRFLLDGSNPIPVEVNPIYQGYASSVMSNGNGEFTTQIPYIDIQFDDYFEFPALSFKFDVGKEEYPKDIRFVVQHDSATVMDMHGYPDKAVWVFEEQIPVCNRITIYFHAMNLAYRRARVTQLVYGITQEISGDQLANVSYSNAVSPDSTELSQMALDFTLFDSEGRYDPENPQGVWEYLESRQPVSVSMTQSLDDDGNATEEIPLCNVYSTGDFSVSGQGGVAQVTIKCTGLLSHLDMTYGKGVFSPNGTSLYDLGQAVAQSIEYQSVIEFDDSLKDITTHLPLPVLPANQLLQLIANAGMCSIKHLRGGGIRIAPESNESTGFKLSFDKMYSAPDTSKIPPLKDVTSTYQSYTKSGSSAEVASIEISSSVATEYVITHGTTYGHSISTSGVTVVGSPQYYAYQTIVKAYGTGTIKVNGYSVELAEVSLTKHFSDVGADLDSVANQLIDNRDHLNSYIDWIASVTQRRTTYETEHRGYPYLDVTDHIKVDSNFESEVDVAIIKDELTYNGAISGKSTLLTLEGGVVE